MPDLPLENITVIDFATILAGPVSSTFLADFGAEVIKVEIPERGDMGRSRFPDGRLGLSVEEMAELKAKGVI